MPSARILRYLLTTLCACLLAGACVIIVLVPARLEDALEQVNGISRSVTGQPLSFGAKPSLSLLPFAIEFTDLHWGDEDSACTLVCRSGRALLNLSWLWGCAARVSGVSLDNPQFVCRGSQGPQALAQGRADAERGSAASRVPQAAELFAALGLERIMVANGSVEIVTAAGDSLTLKNLNLSARGTAVASDLEGDCVAALQSVSGSRREATLALRGSGVLSADTRLAVRLQATLTPLQGIYPGHLGPASLCVDGSLDRNLGCVLERCELTLPRSRAVLKGQGRLVSPAFDGRLALELQTSRMDLPVFVPDLRLRGRIQVEDAMLSMPAFDLTGDAARGQGSLTLSLNPLSLSARLHCADLELRRRPMDATRIAREAAGRQQRQEERQAEARFELDVSADRLRFDGVVFSDARAGIAGTAAGVTLAPVKARLGEGAVDGALWLHWDEKRWSSEGLAVNVPSAAAAALAGLQGSPAGRMDAVWRLAGGGEEETSGTGSITLRGMNADALVSVVSGTTGIVANALPAFPVDARARFSVRGDGLNWRLSLPTLSGQGEGEVRLPAGELRGNLSVLVGEQRVDLALAGAVTAPEARVECVRPRTAQR